MACYTVAIFGLQTGTELLGRIRYALGAVVPASVVEQVTGQQLNVQQTVSLLAGLHLDIGFRFVDVFPASNDDTFVNHLFDDRHHGHGWQETIYEATLTNLVQHASYVTVRLPGATLEALCADLEASGLYELLTVVRV